MLKFAKIENPETKSVSVGIGSNDKFYKSLGMQKMDVEIGIDGRWYLAGHAPGKTLTEAKTAKLAELNTAFISASETAHCLSSAGFEIDANEVANRNIEGLVLVLEPGESTLFRAWDNSFHQVTKEQLETMRKEIVLNSQWLYQAKWTTEEQIKAAETTEALDEIEISAEALTTLANSLEAVEKQKATVAFIEQRNQSIYGSEVNDGQTV